MTQALKAVEDAPIVELSIGELSELKNEIVQELKSKLTEEKINLNVLPQNNVCVPTYVANAEITFVHVVNGKVIEVSILFS